MLPPPLTPYDIYAHIDDDKSAPNDSAHFVHFYIVYKLSFPSLFCSECIVCTW